MSGTDASPYARFSQALHRYIDICVVGSGESLQIASFSSVGSRLVIEIVTDASGKAHEVPIRQYLCGVFRGQAHGTSISIGLVDPLTPAERARLNRWQRKEKKGAVRRFITGDTWGPDDLILMPDIVRLRVKALNHEQFDKARWSATRTDRPILAEACMLLESEYSLKSIGQLLERMPNRAFADDLVRTISNDDTPEIWVEEGSFVLQGARVGAEALALTIAAYWAGFRPVD